MTFDPCKHSLELGHRRMIRQAVLAMNALYILHTIRTSKRHPNHYFPQLDLKTFNFVPLKMPHPAYHHL